ncbi:MAG: hypothetical protein ACOC0Z_02165 [Halohasta sp.]
MQAVGTSSTLVIAGCLSDSSPGNTTGNSSGDDEVDDDAEKNDSSTDDDKDQPRVLTGYTVSEHAVTPAVEHRSDMDAWGVFVGSESVAEEYFGSVDEEGAEQVQEFVEETDFEAGEYLLYVEAYAPETCYELVVDGEPDVAENGLPTVEMAVTRTEPEDEACGEAMTAVDLLVRLSFDLDEGGPADSIEVTVSGHRDDPEEVAIETDR